MATNYREVLYTNKSLYNGKETTFNILAGPGTRPYKGIDLSKDRIIYIKLTVDGCCIEYPYAVLDQLAMWELVFDVWQKPEKKVKYVDKFRRLIYCKLIQAKLVNFAKAYSGEI